MPTKSKHIRVPNDVEAIVERYRVNHGLKYFSDALFEIVRQNNEMPGASVAQTLAELLAVEITKRLKDEMNSDTVAIRLSSRSADRNTQVLLRAINQIMSSMRISHYIDQDTNIMAQCKGITDNEIERYRQLRIDQSHRKRGRKAGSSTTQPPAGELHTDTLPEDGDFVL
mgnify:CR=1 FL=1